MKFFCLAVLLLTCANASESSNNNSSNTSKKVNPVGIDFSNLTSLDAVQEYAIGNIKAFLGSMENSPEYNNSRPQPMFIPNHHIQSIRKVCKPFEVELFVRDATMAYADSTGNETNANSKAASGYIKSPAVKEIVKALQSVNLLEFPFWRLLKFVRGFLSFLSLSITKIKTKRLPYNQPWKHWRSTGQSWLFRPQHSTSAKLYKTTGLTFRL